MSELILRIGENNPFENKPYTTQISQSLTVSRNGNNYTQITYSTGMSVLSRIVQLIKALAITVLTAGLGLFSKNLRKKWTIGCGKNEITKVLKPEQTIPLPPIPTTLEEWKKLHIESRDERRERKDRLEQDVLNGRTASSYCFIGHCSMIDQDGGSRNAYEKALTMNANAVFDYIRQLDGFAPSFSAEVNATLLKIKTMVLNLCNENEMQALGITFPNDLRASMPQELLRLPVSVEEWSRLILKSAPERADAKREFLLVPSPENNEERLPRSLALGLLEMMSGDEGASTNYHTITLWIDSAAVFNHLRTLNAVTRQLSRFMVPSLETDAALKHIKKVKNLVLNICTAENIEIPVDLRPPVPIAPVIPEALRPAFQLDFWLEMTASKEARETQIENLHQRVGVEKAWDTIAILHLFDDREDSIKATIKSKFERNPQLAFNMVRELRAKVTLFTFQSENMNDVITPTTVEAVQNFSRLSSEFALQVTKLKGIVSDYSSLKGIEYPTDLL